MPLFRVRVRSHHTGMVLLDAQFILQNMCTFHFHFSLKIEGFFSTSLKSELAMAMICDITNGSQSQSATQIFVTWKLESSLQERGVSRLAFLALFIKELHTDGRF